MIPFVDLKVQYRSIKSEVDTAVTKVVESGDYVLGKEVAEFETEFAAYTQAEYAIGVNTGTSALHLALLAAGVGSGDEVITVPFTFVATVAAIVYTGAIPVFVDIDPLTYTMDPTQIERAITPQTKAVMPVHLYGHPADMDPILDISRKHGLVVMEDACQAHGTEYKGRKVGTLGDLGGFSFYPGKNLGAYGEGGMVVTNHSEYARTIRMLRNWGQEKKYHHVLKGYNYRLDELQAAILRVKLRHLDKWTKMRRLNAQIYKESLELIGIKSPEEKAYAKHVYHIYAIRTQQREYVQQKLSQLGVQTGIHYPIPVHLLSAYSDLGYKKGDFPYSEQASNEVLSLPMFAELTEEQITTVCQAVGNSIAEEIHD